jgi:hypothetical protein
MQLITATSIITISSIMGISLSGLSQAFAQVNENDNPTTTNGLEWKTYSNDKFGFSVEYPSNWIVKEKTNRFEPGVEITIASNKSLQNPTSGAFFVTGNSPVTIDDIEVLTNYDKKLAVDDYFDINYDRKMVEDTNITKYMIGGEKAGSFTYGEYSKDTNNALTGIEQVVTTHNGKFYFFTFQSSTKYFDDPSNTAIRTHMFESIRWLT